MQVLNDNDTTTIILIKTQFLVFLHKKPAFNIIVSKPAVQRDQHKKGQSSV